MILDGMSYDIKLMQERYLHEPKTIKRLMQDYREIMKNPIDCIYLDETLGLISGNFELLFQSQVKTIKSTKSFEEIFDCINIKKPSNEYLLNWLRQSVQNSLTKRYHYILNAKKKKKSVGQQKVLLPTLNTEDL